MGEKIYQVQQCLEGKLLKGQTRYVKATSSEKAEEFYASHHGKHPGCTLRSKVIAQSENDVAHWEYFTRP